MNTLEILKIDAKFRVANVKDDLFTLEQLGTSTGWTNELPTLKSRTSKDIQFIKTSEEFKKQLERSYPIFYGLDYSNLLLAGGCVSSLLLKEKSDDIDLFIYGLNEAEANERVNKLIINLYNNIDKLKVGWLTKDRKKEKPNPVEDHKGNEHLYKEYADNTNTIVVYNGNTLTIHINNYKIQVILRLYNTMSEILHGFDLGSSAVGFDGSKVYFTTLSKYCYNNMINIYDGTRRSTTYEYRLKKYCNRGFSIVMPEFDISKLKTDYFKYGLSEVCEMPYLTFSYSSISDNVVSVDGFHGTDLTISDYSFLPGEYCPNLYDSTFYRINLVHLLNNSPEKYSYRNKVYETLKKEKGQWKLTFDKLIFPFSYAELTFDNIHRELKGGKINLKTLNNYYKLVPRNEILTNFTKENYLKELHDKHIAYIKKTLGEQKDVIVKWNKLNPMTQLTSSFNPIIEENSKWYGKYYKKMI